MTPGPDGQAVGCNPTIKQVRLLPASLTDSGVAQVVEHLAENAEAAGSTPAAGTAAQDVGKPGNPPAWGAGERRFKSGHPD